MGCARARVLYWAALGLFVCLTVLGCSTPQQRYKVLSFFFDGVPDPDAPKAVRRSSAPGARPVFIHKPYEEKKCDACHLNTDDIFARAKVKADMCYTCHPKVLDQYEKIHGPVAAGQCMMCHAAHASGEPHLVRVPAPRLCTQCHEPGTFSPNPVEHQDPKANCLACHSGHGGPDLRFLKVASIPATQPVAAAPAEGGVAQ